MGRPLPAPLNPADMKAPWRRQAACRTEDPDLFFPDKTDTDARREAKAICAGCPVRVQCLQFALRHRGTQGIWGGTTHKQRRSILKKRRQAA